MMNKKSLLVSMMALLLALLFTNCSKAATSVVEDVDQGTVNTGEDVNTGDLANGSDDVDGDGILNVDDNDIDGDGILNENDTDIDGDGVDNIDDNDIDGDGVANEEDSDIDGDGVDNIVDTDIDGDGVENTADNDIDGDGVENTEDTDIDGDGLTNDVDPDMDGDGVNNDQDPDIDGDGVNNGVDPDIDGDGIDNATDTDDDGDGTPDSTDSTPDGNTDNDGTGISVRSSETDTLYIDFSPSGSVFEGTDELDFEDFRQRVQDEGGDLATVAVEQITVSAAASDQAFLTANGSVPAQMNIYYTYPGQTEKMIIRTGLLNGSGSLSPITLGDLSGAGITMSNDMAQTEHFPAFAAIMHDPASSAAGFRVEVMVGSTVSGTETVEFYVKIDATADKSL